MERPQLKWHQAELESHFQKFVVDCSARRKVLIFIDALDECRDRDRDRLIGFLHILRRQNRSRQNRLWIFTTSRPYPDGQVEADFQIRLEKENWDDVQTFVEQTLRLPDESPSDTEELKRTLVSRADGLFLWLVLVIPRIHDMSAKGLSLRRIQSDILNCPRELDSLYEGLLEKIDDSELLEACVLF